MLYAVLDPNDSRKSMSYALRQPWVISIVVAVAIVVALTSNGNTLGSHIGVLIGLALVSFRVSSAAR
jgi:membrane protein YqaA with SNARE-associated domain